MGENYSELLKTAVFVNLVDLYRHILPTKPHTGLFNPFNAELLGTLASPPMNSWGGGGDCKIIRIFCNVRCVWSHQQDLSLWANNNMRRSCALLVDNTKFMSRSHQGHFLSKILKITPGPFLKAHLNKHNYNYAAACSISLGFHRKRLIHNWGWRLIWVEVVIYCLDAAQNKREGYFKVMENVRFISLWVMCTKCAMIR